MVITLGDKLEVCDIIASPPNHQTTKPPPASPSALFLALELKNCPAGRVHTRTQRVQGTIILYRPKSPDVKKEIANNTRQLDLFRALRSVALRIWVFWVLLGDKTTRNFLPIFMMTYGRYLGAMEDNRRNTAGMKRKRHFWRQDRQDMSMTDHQISQYLFVVWVGASFTEC